jgi:hypothetical protein
MLAVRPPPALERPDALPRHRWEAIVVGNVVVKLATFPITVLTQRKTGKMTVSGQAGLTSQILGGGR